MPPTFAHRLRLIPHRSLLLERARRAGLDGADGFVALAWQRGCRYYPRGAGEVPSGCVSFSNEELAIALMHPSLPWDPQRLRVAAAMVGASGNDCRRLARLAVQEQAVVPLAMVARAGREAEPGNPFWSDLLRCLPEAPPASPGSHAPSLPLLRHRRKDPTRPRALSFRHLDPAHHHRSAHDARRAGADPRPARRGAGVDLRLKFMT